MQSVASVWLAYRPTGSISATATIGFLSMAPYTVLTPIAAAGHITITLLAIFGSSQGVSNSIRVPTRRPLFAQLIDDKNDLPNAIALKTNMVALSAFTPRFLSVPRRSAISLQDGSPYQLAHRAPSSFAV
jgi:hypothetical protein